EKRLISLCVGCGNQIHDQYILRVSPDLEWHAACLKCAECNQYLDETCTCFVRDGKTYCKRDYIRYRPRPAPRKPAGFGDARPLCGRRGEPHGLSGSRASVASRDVACARGEVVAETRPTLGAAAGPAAARNARVRGTPAEGPRPRPPACPPPAPTAHRVRESSLHTLRTCYAANPRPDALMKEQLVEMTGLSPRVIRVWFQNKRCKDKKRSIMMKQLQQQQPNDKTNIQGMTGTPMVAASPERHDGGLQANPVEVQSYQPPWKVLSDFALQSDIDQPAFQQLVS
ncbi:ISL1 protein, partial [Pachycephala philippinensis]|nr:ISL1 protein [Pachycephala philippinensis]